MSVKCKPERGASRILKLFGVVWLQFSGVGTICGVMWALIVVYKKKTLILGPTHGQFIASESTLYIL